MSFAFPALGSRPIGEISAREVLTVLKKVEARGIHETARKLRTAIGDVFRYAIATARAENDPTIALRGALVTPTVTPRAAIVAPKAFGYCPREERDRGERFYPRNSSPKSTSIRDGPRHEACGFRRLAWVVAGADGVAGAQAFSLQRRRQHAMRDLDETSE
jgi:hypothetical protein